MSKRKTGFTYEQHKEMGRVLSSAKNTLGRAMVDASSAYPKASKQVTLLRAAADAVNKAQSAMDSQLFKDCPGEEGRGVYYCGAPPIQDMGDKRDETIYVVTYSRSSHDKETYPFHVSEFSDEVLSGYRHMRSRTAPGRVTVYATPDRDDATRATDAFEQQLEDDGHPVHIPAGL